MKQLYSIEYEADAVRQGSRENPCPGYCNFNGGDIGCPFIDRVFDNNWSLPELECFITKALIPCGLAVCKGF